MKRFHNTISLEGAELVAAQSKCKTQEELIIGLFEKYPSQLFSPPEVQQALGMDNTPLTSIRRGITNLQKDDKLIKTDKKVMGIYGVENYKWQLKFKNTLF